jgi:hypothetical protein
VDRPGEYAFVEGRRAAVVLLPDAAGAVSIGQGRGGIDLGGASHVVIRNLAFENMTAVVGNVRSGVPIQNAVFKGEDIRIEGNRFSHLWMANGQGAISLRGVRGVTVERNSIETVAIGSGIRISKLSDAKVTGNTVRRVGRTGIMVMSVVGAEIQGNTISDIQGVHGNGLSVYLDNQNVRVVGNTVTGSTRPVTFHGGGKVTDNGLVFTCNLFVGTADSDAALTSWSSDEPIYRLSITGNVLLGGKMGARLSGSDRGVTVAGNLSNGIKTRGVGPGADWTMTDNKDVDFDAKASPSRLEELRRKTCTTAPGA